MPPVPAATCSIHIPAGKMQHATATVQFLHRQPSNRRFGIAEAVPDTDTTKNHNKSMAGRRKLGHVMLAKFMATYKPKQ